MEELYYSYAGLAQKGYLPKKTFLEFIREEFFDTIRISLDWARKMHEEDVKKQEKALGKATFTK